MAHSNSWRKTSQHLLPLKHTPTPEGVYDIYPSFPIGSGLIKHGFDALASQLSKATHVIIDGYVGVFWEDFRERLDRALKKQGVEANWVAVDQALRPQQEIQALVEPFLGGDDPLFGTKFTGTLLDFFDREQLARLQPSADAKLNVIYGCGAVLANWEGLLVYVDLPKNEIQFRSRAGSICNLGAREPADPKAMYKRFYFVDWVALNRLKAELTPRIDLIVDGQRPNDPALMTGDALRAGLREMSRNYFRVRPWFEPGAWGGQWLKRHIPQLPQDVPNYAWSFELIVPENGLLFESDGQLLEVSFDFLMYFDYRAVLGTYADSFGFEFPIRFDYLDTVEGGNLSVQCHPSMEYVREQFGETFTQDETYYLLHAEPGARVFIGFQEDIDPGAFRHALEQSARNGGTVDVDRFVYSKSVQKHDLILIPNGTIHCSGEGSVVLEISATPYIFTMKMYDWARLDLDGKPRTLNIERAFDNLNFERKGQRVQEELIAHPVTLRQGPGWRIIHLPTTPVHFYDIHRMEFGTQLEVSTEGSCHVLCLVEGDAILLQTANGYQQRFNYAETFVVPAAAGRYRLLNLGPGMAKVVKAFLKRGLDDYVNPDR